MNANEVALTHNQHFRFGYNADMAAFRLSETDAWRVSYGQCAGQPGNFGQECIRAARLIGQMARGPIRVLFSGGIDSEVALRSFLAAGVDMSAVILRFADDLNIHDISHAVVTCESLNVKYRFFNMDVRDFFSSREAWAYAELTACVTPQFLPTMWLADQIDGFTVIGSGDCLIVRSEIENDCPRLGPYSALFSAEPVAVDGGPWNLWEKEKVAAFYRFFLKRKREACPGFFQYTPELIASFITDEITVRYLNLAPDSVMTAGAAKYPLYKKYFPIAPRPKYTGYERLRDDDMRLRRRLLEAFPGANAVFRTPVSRWNLGPAETPAVGPAYG